MSYTDITQYFAFAGTLLVVIAYIPQIVHLLKERCSSGISAQAFWLWFLATILFTIHAIALEDPPFILVGGIEIVFNSIVLGYTYKYKYGVCKTHL